MAVEDVVAQNQASRLAADELAAHDEGVGQAARRRLLDIAELHAPLAPVPQQAAELRQRLGRADDQHIANPASMSIESG